MFKILKRNARKTIFQKVDTPFYDPKTLIRLIQSQYLSFHRESLEFKIKLGINLSRSDQNVRGSVNIPLGQKKVIYFIGTPEQNNLALQNNVDKIVDEKVFEQWDKEVIEFDTLFATTEGVKLLKPYAKFLGPKGLFPNLKVNTLISEDNIEKSIKNARLGKLDIQNDSKGELRGVLGKLEFDRETLFENYNELLRFVISKKPKDQKDKKNSKDPKMKYIKEIYLGSTRGKYYRVDLTTGDPQNNNYVFKYLKPMDQLTFKRILNTCIKYTLRCFNIIMIFKLNQQWKVLQKMIWKYFQTLSKVKNQIFKSLWKQQMK